MCPSAYDKGYTAMGKRGCLVKDSGSVGRPYESWRRKWQPDPYLTQISIPEEMYNYMQEKIIKLL